MAKPITKAEFIADLVMRIREHQTKTRTTFQPLDTAQLAWSPAPREWSILQCFDHLNQTHDYYNTNINAVLAKEPPQPAGAEDMYKPSFWAGIYMYFAFNPRMSFPAPANTSPGAMPDVEVLDIYLENQQALLNLLDEAESMDVTQTRISLKRGIRFNLGDCLKVLVYHDRLHMRQAEGIRKQLGE